jgi:hypothetical protein
MRKTKNNRAKVSNICNEIHEIIQEGLPKGYATLKTFPFNFSYIIEMATYYAKTQDFRVEMGSDTGPASISLPSDSSELEYCALVAAKESMLTIEEYKELVNRLI